MRSLHYARYLSRRIYRRWERASRNSSLIASCIRSCVRAWVHAVRVGGDTAGENASESLSRQSLGSYDDSRPTCRAGTTIASWWSERAIRYLARGRFRRPCYRVVTIYNSYRNRCRNTCSLFYDPHYITVIVIWRNDRFYIRRDRVQ